MAEENEYTYYPDMVHVDYDLDENSSNAVQNRAIAEALSGIVLSSDSPHFTGTPTVPTPDRNSSSSAIVNIEYLDNLLGSLSEVDTQLNANSSNAIANSVVTAALSLKAPLDSPVFTGTPTVPTPDLNGDPEQIVNLQFLNDYFDLTGHNNLVIDSELNSESSNPVANFVVVSALEGKAPLDSPAFVGTPTAPTASTGTNTTQIATTQFVYNTFVGIISDIDEFSAWKNSLANANEMEF